MYLDDLCDICRDSQPNHGFYSISKRQDPEWGSRSALAGLCATTAYLHVRPITAKAAARSTRLGRVKPRVMAFDSVYYRPHGLHFSRLRHASQLVGRFSAELAGQFIIAGDTSFSVSELHIVFHLDEAVRSSFTKCAIAVKPGLCL